MGQMGVEIESIKKNIFFKNEFYINSVNFNFNFKFNINNLDTTFIIFKFK